MKRKGRNTQSESHSYCFFRLEWWFWCALYSLQVYLWVLFFILFSSLVILLFCFTQSIYRLFSLLRHFEPVNMCSFQHAYTHEHTLPIHLIKIRQNEKCDKSIYISVILDIALLLRCAGNWYCTRLQIIRDA